MAAVSFSKTREMDYKYDPLFIFAGAKDYYKAGAAAKVRSAKYAIRPIFYSMFSTLSTVPRYRIVMTKSEPIAPFSEKNAYENIPTIPSIHDNVSGKYYLKFFKSATSLTNVVPELQLPQTPTTPKKVPKPIIDKKLCNAKTQTKYRESSMQTSPWEPDYVVNCEKDEDPELLKLDFLKWGSGLPCGAHEVILIQRARMKREWEKNLPPCDTPENLAKRIAFIAAMERNEYAFREQEIQEIQDLRLHLLELMLQELHEKSHMRSKEKLRRFCSMKEKEKEEKLAKIKKEHDREYRRLKSNFKGIISKYKAVNVIDEFISKKSERYVPLMRHGEHPKRWHQVIDEHNKLYKTRYRDVQDFNPLPKWLYDAYKLNPDALKLPGTRLCIRETKWTAPVLKNLHEDLKNLNKHIRKTYSLRVKIDKSAKAILTPEVDSITDEEEEIHQAAVLLQSVIRGRASQKLIYDGRERCKELIQELKSTQALLEKDKKKIFAEKLEVLYQQREHCLCLQSALRIKEGLKKIQGSVIGTMLDFLSKELRRLLDERKAHAMCLLYDRERQMREAAEAHRRQLELRRRQEHDEIFKQVIKVHQDTVDLYLQDIITEGMEFASEEDAKQYVQGLAAKIDEGMDVVEEVAFDDQEEMVADLVHNFVLPEVEKQFVRERIKKKQAKYLKTVHETVYNKIEQLPNIEKPHLEETMQEESYGDIQITETGTITKISPSMESEFMLQQQELDAEEISEDERVLPSDTEKVEKEETIASEVVDKEIEELFVEERVSAVDVQFFRDIEDISEEEIIYE